MANSNQFSRFLHSWSKIFMRHSIHDLIRFSKEYSLSMPQMSVLFHLHHGNEYGVSSIGEHLGVTNAAASQMIDRLVQNGLVERTEDPEDRRVKQLKLTGMGASIVQEGIEIRQRWIDDLTNRLTLEEQKTITTALTMLTNAAEDLDLNRDHVAKEVINR